MKVAGSAPTLSNNGRWSDSPPVTAEKIREKPVAGISKSLSGLNNCDEPILLNASGS